MSRAAVAIAASLLAAITGAAALPAPSGARPQRAAGRVVWGGRTSEGMFVGFDVYRGSVLRFAAVATKTCPGGGKVQDPIRFGSRPVPIRRGTFTFTGFGIKVTGHIHGNHASGTASQHSTPVYPGLCSASIRWSATSLSR